jgi:LysM domain
MKRLGLITSLPSRSPWGKAGALAWLFVLAMLCGGLPQAVHAAGQGMAIPATASPTEADLRPNVEQPYIVKKGDTLWDIANHFFRDPFKWLKIWEQNLYISNPDLIYPGNKIWFSPKAVKTGGLLVEKLHPEIHIKPAEHIEPAVNTSMVVTALQRQDFIGPDDMAVSGYVLNSPDDRINYGANDKLYVKLQQPADIGSVFDVFRATDPVTDPATGKVAGILVTHLGQVRVTGQSGDVTEALVTRAFEEISRGDRLKPAKSIDTNVQPDYPAKPLAGDIMYLRDNAEAGQYQVVGINLGALDGLKTGSVLNVLRKGRIVEDPLSGAAVTLPEENIGQLMVLDPQPHASIALVTRSTDPIKIGDVVRNAERP